MGRGVPCTSPVRGEGVPCSGPIWGEGGTPVLVLSRGGAGGTLSSDLIGVPPPYPRQDLGQDFGPWGTPFPRKGPVSRGYPLGKDEGPVSRGPPPPMDGQTPVKTLPTHILRNAGGKNILRAQSDNNPESLRHKIHSHWKYGIHFDPHIRTALKKSNLLYY